ncbi:MAG: tyrosine-type recombinase/integrase, partial [Rhodospirillales bacterium]|nr:tyrosine-type recombinase/integrase [Rhodospirillales bacterium]
MTRTGALKKDVSSSRHIETFLEMMSAERGAAVNTLDAYRRDLADFEAFARRRGRPIEAAGEKNIRDYLAAMRKSGRATTTQARRLSVLRRFFEFLHAEKLRGDDPTLHLDSPKLGRPLPKYLSEGEVERLIAEARKIDGANGIRLTALMEVLYATGLRVSELVGLRLTSLSRDGQMVLVRGKGDKERLVPLGDPARDAVASYLEQRSRFLGANKSSIWLFPSKSRAGHMGRVHFSRLLKELAVAAGLDPKRVSPHVLR